MNNSRTIINQGSSSSSCSRLIPLPVPDCAGRTQTVSFIIGWRKPLPSCRLQHYPVSLFCSGRHRALHYPAVLQVQTLKVLHWLFCTCHGYFKYTVMLFRLCNAANCCQWHLLWFLSTNLSSFTLTTFLFYPPPLKNTECRIQTHKLYIILDKCVWEIYHWISWFCYFYCLCVHGFV